jgi:hypothetical protein
VTFLIIWPCISFDYFVFIKGFLRFVLSVGSFLGVWANLWLVLPSWKLVRGFERQVAQVGIGAERQAK